MPLNMRTACPLQREITTRWLTFFYFCGRNVCGSVSKYFLCQRRKWFQICGCRFCWNSVPEVRLCNVNCELLRALNISERYWLLCTFSFRFMYEVLRLQHCLLFFDNCEQLSTSVD
jgi:hypothetical protein